MVSGLCLHWYFPIHWYFCVCFNLISPLSYLNSQDVTIFLKWFQVLSDCLWEYPSIATYLLFPTLLQKKKKGEKVMKFQIKGRRKKNNNEIYIILYVCIILEDWNKTQKKPFNPLLSPKYSLKLIFLMTLCYNFWNRDWFLTFSFSRS